MVVWFNFIIKDIFEYNFVELIFNTQKFHVVFIRHFVKVLFMNLALGQLGLKP